MAGAQRAAHALVTTRAVTATGEVVSAVTSAVEVGSGKLLLGNLHQRYLAVLDLQALASGQLSGRQRREAEEVK